MSRLTEDRRKELAKIRAEEIMEAWWREDRWEFAEEHNLTDEELAEVLNTHVYMEVK